MGDTEYGIHEISLTPNIFALTPKGIFSGLVHEMVHLWQFEYGKPSRNGYHNKEWAWKMKEVGMIPSHTGKAGGKETGEKMSHYIERGGRFEKAFMEMPKEYILPLTTYANKELFPARTGSKKANKAQEKLIEFFNLIEGVRNEMQFQTSRTQHLRKEDLKGVIFITLIFKPARSSGLFIGFPFV